MQGPGVALTLTAPGTSASEHELQGADKPCNSKPAPLPHSMRTSYYQDPQVASLPQQRHHLQPSQLMRPAWVATYQQPEHHRPLLPLPSTGAGAQTQQAQPGQGAAAPSALVLTAPSSRLALAAASRSEQQPPHEEGGGAFSERGFCTRVPVAGEILLPLPEQDPLAGPLPWCHPAAAAALPLPSSA